MRRKDQKAATTTLGVIRTAKKLSLFIFNDESQFKKIYGLKEELGLFHLNGQICGRPETITARIAERERASVDAA